MSRKSSPKMSLAEFNAHQARHGFAPIEPKTGKKQAGGAFAPLNDPSQKEIKRRKMTTPEIEMELMLEFQKSAGQIKDFKYEGMSLAWGYDPKTKRPMRYKPDFVVTVQHSYEHQDDGIKMEWVQVKFIEVKGARIWPQDLIRFKGCRAEWPQFEFELWKLEKHQWTQLI